MNAKCPKCGGLVITDIDERKCLSCGGRDYGYAPPPPAKTAITAARIWRLRYKGAGDVNADIVVHMEVRRKSKMGWQTRGGFESSRPMLVPFCPFCPQEMSETSLSGKGLQRARGERRFACETGHRISVIPTAMGGYAWI